MRMAGATRAVALGPHAAAATRDEQREHEERAREAAASSAHQPEFEEHRSARPMRARSGSGVSTPFSRLRAVDLVVARAARAGR